MSVDLLERAAAQLGALVDDVAFVGGATVVLWITDPASPPVRATKDVDIVVGVSKRAAWHEFERRLRDRGFREDSSSTVICRWQGPGDDLILDAMPAEARLLGFENRWQAPGLLTAAERKLPSGARIRALTPPYLLATKLEAWKGRGKGDHLASHDLEDVIALVEGREELAAEMLVGSNDLRDYVSAEIRQLLEEPRFADAVDGFVRGPVGRQRVRDVVWPRLEALGRGA